jgi:hypothetical protein
MTVFTFSGNLCDLQHLTLSGQGMNLTIKGTQASSLSFYTSELLGAPTVFSEEQFRHIIPLPDNQYEFIITGRQQDCFQPTRQRFFLGSIEILFRLETNSATSFSFQQQIHNCIALPELVTLIHQFVGFGGEWTLRLINDKQALRFKTLFIDRNYRRPCLTSIRLK